MFNDSKTLIYSALPISRNTCCGSSSGSAQYTGGLGVAAKTASNYMSYYINISPTEIYNFKFSPYNGKNCIAWSGLINIL